MESETKELLKNALGYPLLRPKSPVPSDIEVSQQIVKEVGLLPMADLAKQYVLLLLPSSLLIWVWSIISISVLNRSQKSMGQAIILKFLLYMK